MIGNRINISILQPRIVRVASTTTPSDSQPRMRIDEQAKAAHSLMGMPGNHCFEATLIGTLHFIYLFTSPVALECWHGHNATRFRNRLSVIDVHLYEFSVGVLLCQLFKKRSHILAGTTPRNSELGYHISVRVYDMLHWVVSSWQQPTAPEASVTRGSGARISLQLPKSFHSYSNNKGHNLHSKVNK